MDFNVTVGPYDLSKKTMRWYTDELPAMQKEMKKTLGLQFDGSRLRYEDHGSSFAILLTQQQGAKGSQSYSTYSKMPGFKAVGKSKWSNAIVYNVFTLHMWNSNGGTSLLSKTFVCDMLEPIPVDVRKAMAKKAQEYTRGIVHCSHCGKELQRANVAGRYFAGIYCSHCWEQTYKAIEARETYN